ncbi:uncharacterized protein LOC128712942 [Anopheles marshallii]|uniref:uncharacterized protein LOC128712942 n=1 Tax=Anopheles marshallii TaxID=1521116 RepID=UPI00237A289D|nr:uncharacterized protein LOC128712942 [Anopheles marshallii]
MQQVEIPNCCQMEPLAPEHLLTKCEELVAADSNPGTDMYDVCLKQCIFEELGAIDGYEMHLEMLYPVMESFPVDYRQAVRLAIDECNGRLQHIQKHKPKRCQQCEEQCPMLGQQVERCLEAATYNNCPISRWRASTACNKVRRKVPFC